MSDIAQKLKQGNIFWKIENNEMKMKMPVNRHYYSLVTENVDSMCQTKTVGWGGGVYVLVVLMGGRWMTLQTKQGGSLHPGLWGDRHPCIFLHAFLINNTNHVLQQYLPNCAQSRYNLRKWSHNKTLTNKTICLNE